MAFTGAATIKQVSERCVRVTGLSLAFGASGAFCLFGGTTPNALPLPRAFDPHDYLFEGELVTLLDSMRVTILPVADVAAFAVPIRVVKNNLDPVTFNIELTNDAAATNSAELEIEIEFRD